MPLKVRNTFKGKWNNLVNGVYKKELNDSLLIQKRHRAYSLFSRRIAGFTNSRLP